MLTIVYISNFPNPLSKNVKYNGGSWHILVSIICGEVGVVILRRVCEFTGDGVGMLHLGSIRARTR